MKHPFFTVAGLSTLGLGIGANTAVFSVVDAVLLKPLPCPDAERLVRVREEQSGMLGLFNMSIITNDTLEPWRDDTNTLDYLAGYRPTAFTLTGDDDPLRLQGGAQPTDILGLVLGQGVLLIALSLGL